MISTVPNQRVIKVSKAPRDKEHKYMMLNLAAMDAAITNLSKPAFILFLYFSKNQADYTFALSAKSFCEWSGYGETSYRSAFKELEEKGYLVRDGCSNRYTFCEEIRTGLADNSFTF